MGIDGLRVASCGQIGNRAKGIAHRVEHRSIEDAEERTQDVAEINYPGILDLQHL